MEVIAKVYRHVEIPKNKGAFLEFVGLVFDTRIVLENELEVERRTTLDEVDKYFYGIILSPLRNNGRSYIPFK